MWLVIRKYVIFLVTVAPSTHQNIVSIDERRNIKNEITSLCSAPVKTVLQLLC
jgi:hypothetical protein